MYVRWSAPFSADSTNPPGSITICGYVTYANEIGIWWFNPYDPDFGGVEMWLDDVYLGNTTSGDHFYNAYSAVVGTHTFSTHSFDNSGNVNSTWVNLTFMTKEYPGCTENWTCDTCSRPVIPRCMPFPAMRPRNVPLAVQFNDTSTGYPRSGTGRLVMEITAIQSPAHTYASAGAFTVSLNATNAAGSNISHPETITSMFSAQKIPPAACLHRYSDYWCCPAYCSVHRHVQRFTDEWELVVW